VCGLFLDSLEEKLGPLEQRGVPRWRGGHAVSAAELSAEAGPRAAVGRRLWPSADRRLGAVELRFAPDRLGEVARGALCDAWLALRASLTRSLARSPADDATCPAPLTASLAAETAASPIMMPPASP
jgi:hypothetical protein